MAKHKNRRQRRQHDDRSTELRIPIGRLPIEALEELPGMLTKPGVMPHSIDVESVVRAMLPGTFYRVARGIDQCPAGHQDGVIVGMLRPGAEERMPNARSVIVLTCVDECEGRMVNLFFDRETAKQLVNRIGEVVAESERRMEAAVS